MMPAAIKKLIFFIILLLCSINIHAQQKPAYKLFFEKVYLHTDRDVYMQNDTIWFKAYLVNAQNNAPIGTSGNLYVELINTDSAKVGEREIIRLENGKGNGDFKLTDSIPSGKYILRAYTNWMRNFGYNFVFEKSITVYNTEVKQTVGVAVSQKLIVKTNKTGAAKPFPVTTVPIARFYPEGGSLIEGISSIIGVKACDVSGKGIVVNGSVLSATGDTVAHFSCDTLGMGRFALLPVQGQTYHTVINYQNKAYQIDLPTALIKGLALRISSSDTLIDVLITNTDTSIIHQVTLVGRHAGRIYSDQQFTLTNGQAMVKLSKSLFPEGIAAITLYDDHNKPHCERLVYIHHQNNPTLTITTDKPIYQPKGKTTVKLRLSDTTQRANLSVAVVDESIVPTQNENIASYLLLTSEIKGNIEHPERYFDTTNVNRTKQLDLLLMTQGWRDFLWRRIADSAIRISYLPESGISVSGKVREKFSKTPLKGMNITLTAFKAQGQKLFTARTDTVGKFLIDDLPVYGPDTLKITARNDKGKKAGWLIVDTLSDNEIPVTVKPDMMLDTTHKNVPPALIERKQQQSHGNMKTGIHLKEVNVKARKTTIAGDIAASTFGYPDQVFTITKKDEYFQALDNWLAHNVQGVHYPLSADPGVELGGDVSRIFVNGVMIDDWALGKWVLSADDTKVSLQMNPADKMMQQTIRQPYFDLTMDKVKKVIYKHLVGVDPTYAKTIDVILLYLTVTQDALAKGDMDLALVDVTGYYNARTFYKPIYDTPKNLNKSDYRTTIHWEPNINTDKNDETTISFYNADPKTSVRIVAEGITAQGVPVAGSARYNVK